MYLKENLQLETSYHPFAIEINCIDTREGTLQSIESFLERINTVSRCSFNSDGSIKIDIEETNAMGEVITRIKGKCIPIKDEDVTQEIYNNLLVHISAIEMGVKENIITSYPELQEYVDHLQIDDSVVDAAKAEVLDNLQDEY